MDAKIMNFPEMMILFVHHFAFRCGWAQDPPPIIFIHVSYTFDSQDVNDCNEERRRLKKEEKDIKRNKIAIKREQTKACFQFAERERFIQK